MARHNIMACGCSGQATNGHGQPCCPVHGTAQPMTPQPDLNGRVARCSDCGKVRPSSPDAAFFIYQPDRPQDSYYCGCRGWN